MAINLLNTVQENLHYPQLQKINPNTQEADQSTTTTDNFSQAAIPVILTGLYKLSSSDEGAEAILSEENSTDWVSKIFNNNKQEIIEKIAAYSNPQNEISSTELNNIATESIKVIKENLPENATFKDVRLFLSNQTDNIFPYLHASLHAGDLLNDTTVDDNTNKMEGPISSMMHSIGTLFSTPETEEDKTGKI
jgi:hypothetical protein